MATNERLKGIQVHRPIIYGSQARLLTEEEKATAPPGHTHKWTVFLTSAATPPPEKSASSSHDPAPVDKDYLPGGEDDLSYVFKRVVFRLHETYPTPNRVCDKMPYKVTETGWGEFTVQIKITFVPEAGEKAITLQHPIKLHHWGEPIEPPPAVALPVADSQAPTPATEKNDEDGDVKMEAEEGDVKRETGDVKGETGEGEGETGDVKGESETPIQTPAEPSQVPTEVSETPAEDAPQAPIAAAPLVPTVASTYPVHAWQYDEVVFSDPPANFMSILEDHPPTALPPRPRRARDQREEYELKTGKKKARPSSGLARGSVSRAGTEAAEGVNTRAGTPATPQTPAFVGVPGELGSADVPLEFSADMEKGEANKLTEVRIHIVKEMDRWRERLIAQEKELARVKEELGGGVRQ